jgi:tRNA nucleotidyltransferase (CCA-adding enzyme)
MSAVRLPEGALVVPSEVRFITDKLRAHGKRGWLVGGCVRDLLMGRPQADWDLATDALPEEVIRIFPRTIPTGIDHGTVTVMVGKTPTEVTTLRGEGAYTDGRHPDAVHFVSEIERDLARRDFTVNAIAIDPIDLTIVDPFGGQKDLEARVLRAVGVARERFEEDGLRVLRAARFVATLDFDLDPDTFAAIEPTLATFRKVSPERVRDEWVKTMKAKRPSRAFDVMLRGGILGVTCPELVLGVGMEQNRYHAFDVFKHAMECLDACTGDPILRIAALLHDVGKPQTRAMSAKTNDYTFYEHERVGAEIADPICQRLRFSNDERARIVDLVRHHLFHYTDEWSDATVRRWIRRVGKDRVVDLYALNEADVRAKGKDPSPDLAALAMLKAHVEKVSVAGLALTTRDLKINGHALMRELGRPPGPWLKEVLEGLLEAVTNDPALNEPEVLVGLGRKLAEGPSLPSKPPV